MCGGFDFPKLCGGKTIPAVRLPPGKSSDFQAAAVQLSHQKSKDF